MLPFHRACTWRFQKRLAPAEHCAAEILGVAQEWLLLPTENCYHRSFTHVLLITRRRKGKIIVHANNQLIAQSFSTNIYQYKQCQYYVY